MLRLVGFLLIALAAGLRSKSDPSWPWEEHGPSSAEELQELLSTVLAQTSAAEVTVEEPGDVEARERTLRERIATITKDWQSASAPACHQQLGRLMNSLTLKCDGLQPKADWLLDYYVPTLPSKTCADSVSDIFALGNELVETLRVSRDSVASVDVAGETLRRYQALSFLRSWLVDLTRTHHHALLWAGFWDGDPENRTTMTKLSNFAKAIEHATVHPNTFLGRAIEASENLDACYEDALTRALAGNMWSIASMSFVLGMRERAQGTVIALVNKQITGERNLSESVLSTHEIPTLGLAAWGLGFWSPEVLVVDLMGTCEQTSPALQKRLLARLPSWAKSMTNWSPEAFAMRSRLRWQCIDCSGACSLDEAFARQVEKLVKAKVEQDRKDRELHEVADPHCEVVASAETGIRTEIRLLQRLKMSLWKKDDLEKVWEVGGLLASWGEDLPDQVSEAELVNQELDSPERQLRLEQLLRQNADPNAPDRLGSTALLCAAAAGHPELIQPLLDARAQVEVHSRFGATALMGAARAGHLEVVEALVKARAQLEARNERGDTALLVAATNGQLKVVESLLTAGAQLEARRDIGTTALMLSSIQGHLKVVEALVRAGAQLDARDGHGLTALRMAARGANTAVEAARFGGHPEVVEVLRKAGAQY